MQLAAALCTTDLRGLITGWSPGAEALLGWSRRDVATMRLADIVASPEGVEQALLHAHTGLEWNGRWHLRLADGSTSAFLVWMTPVTRPEGSVDVVISFAPGRDAPAYARGATRVEDRLRPLVSGSPLGVFMADENGAGTYANAKAQEIGGFSLEGQLGDGWARSLHPDDRGAALESWRTAVAARVGWSRELRFVHPDGSCRWVQARSSPMMGADGGVIGFVGTLEDITERRMAEAKLSAALDAEREARERAEATRDEIESILTSMTDGVVAIDDTWRVTVLNRAAAEYYRVAAGLRPEQIVGHNLFEVFPEVKGTIFCDEYERVMREQTFGIVEDYYAPFDRYYEVRVYPRPPGIAIYFHDVSERRRSQDLQRRRSAQQLAIADLGVRALEGVDLGVLIEDATLAIARTLGVPFVRYLEYRPSEQACVLLAGLGWRDGCVGDSRVLVPGSPSGHCIQHNEPVLVDDWTSESRWEMPPLLAEHSVVSSATVVVHGDPHPVGVLGADSDAPQAFSDDDVHFLQSVANLISISVQRKRFEDELRRTVEQLQALDRERSDLMARMVGAAEQERRRVARDIHDDSIQVVAGINIRLDALARTLPSGQRRAVEDLQKTAQHAMASLRTLVFDLQPTSLEEEGIAATVRMQLERLAEETGISFVLDDVLEHEPPPGSRSVLYRVAREALTNVRKHAHARKVVVRLTESPGGYHMTITDDGRGFDERAPREPSDGHLGLFSMRHDVETLGGSWRVRSEPGRGTTVEFFVPRLVDVDAWSQGPTADPSREPE